jgi:hypothetical protein
MEFTWTRGRDVGSNTWRGRQGTSTRWSSCVNASRSPKQVDGRNRVQVDKSTHNLLLCLPIVYNDDPVLHFSPLSFSGLLVILRGLNSQEKIESKSTRKGESIETPIT